LGSINYHPDFGMLYADVGAVAAKAAGNTYESFISMAKYMGLEDAVRLAGKENIIFEHQNIQLAPMNPDILMNIYLHSINIRQGHWVFSPLLQTIQSSTLHFPLTQTKGLLNSLPMLGLMTSTA
jgi:hypothetical protein